MNTDEVLDRVTVTVTVARAIPDEVELTISLTGRVLSAIDTMLAGGVCVLGAVFVSPGTARSFHLAPSRVGLGTLSEDPVLRVAARNLSDTMLFTLELEMMTKPAGGGMSQRESFTDIEISVDAPTWSVAVPRPRRDRTHAENVRTFPA